MRTRSLVRLVQLLFALSPPVAASGIEIIIPPLPAAPVVDGQLGDSAWKSAATLAPFQRYGTTVGPTQQTEVRIGYAADALFVAFRCAEERPKQLRKAATKRDDMQWEDDCVEVFLDVHGKRKACFQLIVSAGNHQYDSRVTPGSESEANDITWTADWQSATQIGKDEWSVEMRIPFATLGVDPPSVSTRWAVNFSRNRTPFPVELSSWSFSSEKGFSNFAALIEAKFGPAGAGKTFVGVAAPSLMSETAGAIQPEPKLIPPIRKEIKPEEMGGVRVRAVVRKGEVPILISRPEGISQLQSWPVRVGVPFPRGELPDAKQVRLVDPKGRLVPSQTKVLGTWDNGKSVRWLLVNFDAGVFSQYSLQFGKSVRTSAAKPTTPVMVKQESKAIVVTSGDLRLQINRERNTLIDQLWWKDRPLLRTDGRHGPWLMDQNGILFETAKDATSYKVEVEQAGPLRAVIKGSSWFDDGKGNKVNQSISRIHVTAGQPVVQVQHTFVLTEGGKKRQLKNVSVSLPLAEGARDGERVVAESVAYDSFREGLRKGIELKSSVSVAQLSNRKAVILDGEQPAPQQNECAGGWADITGKDGGIALVARWFSQSFPNEIELTATGDLTYHFWSPRFAHWLDLRPKPWLTAKGNYEIWHQTIVPFVKESKRSHELPVEDGGTMDADGTGVAKTHEFALIFHDAEQATMVPEQALAFQDPIFAYADPIWMTSTEVFQRSTPASGTPSRSFSVPDSRSLLARTDTALDAFIARMISDQRNDKAYEPLYGSSLGIFDFGDDLHSAKYCHRYYSHFFYCSPTMPWHLYFRSGDRATRQLAEANSRHRMDVDMCHYTTDPNSGARAGAWNHDDSGIIHWAGASTTHETTSNYGPHLAYMYYLTGDERAYDVALETVDALKWAEQHGGLRSFQHRGTGMTLWNILELWALTGDSELKRFADHYAQEHVKAVRKDLAIGYYPENPSDFTLSYVMPAMIRYHMFTGDPKVAAWIVNQAAHLAEVQRPSTGSGFAHCDGPAYAYQLTGDPQYLQAAREHLKDLLYAIDRDSADEHLRVNSFIGYRVWWMYQAPMLLAGLKAAGDPRSITVRGNDLATQGDVIALNENGKPLQIDVAVQLGRAEQSLIEKAAQAGDLAIVLRNPKNEIVSRSVYPGGKTFDKWYFFGGWIAKLSDEKTPMKGIYRVELASSVPELALLLKPVASTTRKIMSRVSPDGVSNNGYRYFAYVPAGAKKVGFKTEMDGSGWTWQPINMGRIFDPDGKEVAVLDYRARDYEARRKKSSEWIELIAEVPVGTDAKVWQIEPPPYVRGRKIQLEGVAPYLAATADSCFNPDSKP